MEYENLKNRIFQNKPSTRKYWNFWNMEYSRNIPKKQVNIRNGENFGIWNIQWNIPGIFKKCTTTCGVVKFNQEINTSGRNIAPNLPPPPFPWLIVPQRRMPIVYLYNVTSPWGLKVKKKIRELQKVCFIIICTILN